MKVFKRWMLSKFHVQRYGWEGALVYFFLFLDQRCSSTPVWTILWLCNQWHLLTTSVPKSGLFQVKDFSCFFYTFVILYLRPTTFFSSLIAQSSQFFHLYFQFSTNYSFNLAVIFTCLRHAIFVDFILPNKKPFNFLYSYNRHRFHRLLSAINVNVKAS